MNNLLSFQKKELIKMWRTMKAEVGGRRTEFIPMVDEMSIKGLMNRYEERSIVVKSMKKKWWKK